MTTTIRRTVAVAAAAALMSTLGALTTLHAASAVTVSGHTDGSGTYVRLNVQETAAVASYAPSGGSVAASPLCTDMVNQAYASNVYLSYSARNNCTSDLVTCARQALADGANLSGVNYFATSYYDGSYDCWSAHTAGAPA